MTARIHVLSAYAAGAMLSRMTSGWMVAVAAAVTTGMLVYRSMLPPVQEVR